MLKFDLLYNQMEGSMRLSGSCLLGLCVAIFWSCADQAGAAVTVIGSTHAFTCYRNSLLGITNTDACDEALKEGGLTQRDEAATLVNRGIIYNSVGLIDLALADFEAALELDPELPEAFLNRGNSYFFQKQFEDALDEYDRAIELGIDDMAAARYDRALALAKLYRFEEARDDLEAALELRPDFPDAKSKLDLVQEILAARSTGG